MNLDSWAIYGDAFNNKFYRYGHVEHGLQLWYKESSVWSVSLQHFIDSPYNLRQLLLSAFNAYTGPDAQRLRRRLHRLLEGTQGDPAAQQPGFKKGARQDRSVSGARPNGRTEPSIAYQGATRRRAIQQDSVVSMEISERKTSQLGSHPSRSYASQNPQASHLPPAASLPAAHVQWSGGYPPAGQLHGSFHSSPPQPGGFLPGAPHPSGYFPGAPQPGSYFPGAPQPGGYFSGAPQSNGFFFAGPPPGGYHQSASVPQHGTYPVFNPYPGGGLAPGSFLAAAPAQHGYPTGVPAPGIHYTGAPSANGYYGNPAMGPSGFHPAPPAPGFRFALPAANGYNSGAPGADISRRPAAAAASSITAPRSRNRVIGLADDYSAFQSSSGASGGSS